MILNLDSEQQFIDLQSLSSGNKHLIHIPPSGRNSRKTDVHRWGLPGTWAQPVAQLALNPVCSRIERMEEDAHTAGMGDHRPPGSKLAHCFLEGSVSAWLWSSGSIHFSRGGALTDA